MAMKTCFQVSSVCTTRAVVAAPFASAEHIHLTTCKTFSISSFSLSSSSSPSFFVPSSRDGSRKPRFVCRAKEAVDAVQAVTESSWESLVTANENPVLVEFWAPWCGPCRMIAPVIDDLAKEYAGKISCYKVNTDDCPNIATKYGIRSIPTVLFFNKGEKKESVIGAVPKTTLASTIEKYVQA